MKTNPQILQLLHSLNGLESNTSQQLDLNLFKISHAFSGFLTRLNCSATDLSQSVQSVTKILNRVSLLHFILILNQIDDSFPGLSFFYVMEARHSDEIEGKFFIQRLRALEQKGLLGEIFAPMRCRLINGLLTEKEVEFSDVNKIMNEINHSFTLPKAETETIQKILLSASVKKAEIKLHTLSELEIVSLLNSTLYQEDEDEEYTVVNQYDEDEEE